MSKSELTSILFVNLYLTDCRLQRPYSSRTEMVRKYLSKRISKALVKKTTPKFTLATKAFLVLALLSV